MWRVVDMKQKSRTMKAWRMEEAKVGEQEFDLCWAPCLFLPCQYYLSLGLRLNWAKGDRKWLIGVSTGGTGLTQQIYVNWMRIKAGKQLGHHSISTQVLCTADHGWHITCLPKNSLGVGLQTLSWKHQIVNILGFMGQMVPVVLKSATAWKQLKKNTLMKEHGCVSIKPYLWRFKFEFHIIFTCHKILEKMFFSHLII